MKKIKKRKTVFIFCMVLILSLLSGISAAAGYTNQRYPYEYNETPEDRVTVEINFSCDNLPVMGQDGTELYKLEVKVPYFDLKNYDVDNNHQLSEYCRYPTKYENKVPSYETGDGVQPVKRPTLLHCFIYVMEKYYLGVPEADCGTGKYREQVFGKAEYDVYTADGKKAYEKGGSCLDTAMSDGPTHFYLYNYWGHDMNLNYYVNYQYPVMYIDDHNKEYGATADYILLEDGDVIHLMLGTGSSMALFKDPGYVCRADEEFQVELEFKYTAKNHSVIDVSQLIFFCKDEDGAAANLKVKEITGNQVTISGIPQAGTYKLYTYIKAESARSSHMAPAVTAVTVTPKPKLQRIVSPAAVNVANGTDRSSLALSLPQTVEVVTEDSTVTSAKVAWDLDSLSGSYDPTLGKAQTFSVNGRVLLPETIDEAGIPLSVSVTVNVAAALSAPLSEQQTESPGQTGTDGVPVLKQTAAAPDSVTVTWIEDPGATAGYRIYVKGGVFSEFTKVQDLEPGKHSAVIKKVNRKKLAAGTGYTFKIVSLTGKGKKIQEGKVQKLKAATVTGKPVISKATRSKNGKTVQLKWKKMTGLTGFEVQLSAADPDSYETVKSLGAKKTSCKVSGLNKNTVYYFRIRTFKTVKDTKFFSPWSKAVKVR